MALTSVSFVVFATIQTISVAPGCESSSVISCLLPMLRILTGPDGKDLAFVNDPAHVRDPMDFTDKQSGDFCNISIAFIDCANDYYTRCASGAVGSSNAQQFMAKTAQLVQRCKNPTFVSDARTLMQCANTLHRTKAKTLACSNAATRWTMNDMRPLMPNQNGGLPDLQARKNGTIWDRVCCNMKYYRQCSGSEVTDKCGPQAQQVFNSLQEAVLGAYDCSSRKINCPARPDPSLEDYTPMNFASVLGGSTGGQTNISASILASYTTVGLILLVKAVLSAQWI